MALGAKVDEKLSGVAPLAKAVESLADEVHSIIDDTLQQSNGNTWSIDQIKAYFEQRMAQAIAELRSAATTETQADFAATYRNAKVVGTADPNDAKAAVAQPAPQPELQPA